MSTDDEVPGTTPLPGQARPGYRRRGREDHEPHVTPVVAEAECAYCGKRIEIRREGRRRRFCDSTCRVAFNRRSGSVRQRHEWL